MCHVITISYAQEIMPPCGTEPIDSLAAISQPYYGNNQFLIDLADSVENSGCPSCRTTAGGTATEAYVIPVKIWVYYCGCCRSVKHERKNLTNP